MSANSCIESLMKWDFPSKFLQNFPILFRLINSIYSVYPNEHFSKNIFPYV